MSRKLLLEQELRKAIQNDQLSLVYQSKVELSTGKMVGVESLLRWHHLNLGFISPGEFIPIAEETGQIISIGNWVLREACKQIKYWRDMGYTELNVAVNVSVLQFKSTSFIENLKNALEELEIPPNALELEITESIMQNIEETLEILKH